MNNKKFLAVRFFSLIAFVMLIYTSVLGGSLDVMQCLNDGKSPLLVTPLSSDLQTLDSLTKVLQNDYVRSYRPRSDISGLFFLLAAIALTLVRLLLPVYLERKSTISHSTSDDLNNRKV